MGLRFHQEKKKELVWFHWITIFTTKKFPIFIFPLFEMALRKHMPDCYEESCTFQTVAKTKYRKVWYVHDVYDFLSHFLFPPPWASAHKWYMLPFPHYNSIKRVLSPYILYTMDIQIFQRIPIAKTKIINKSTDNNILVLPLNKLKTVSDKGIWPVIQHSEISKRGIKKRIIKEWIQTYEP